MTSTLHIMGGEGDTQKSWDPDNEDEVEDARRTFEDLKAKGYWAYRVNEDGSRDGPMRTFEPEAGAIIMHKQMAGG